MAVDRRTFLSAGVFASCAAGLSLANADAPPAATPPVPELAGSIPESPDRPGKAAESLGRAGVLVVRSAARWEEWLKRAAQAGYELPAKHAFREIDFARSRLVVALHQGDEGDKLSLRQWTAADRTMRVELLESYIIYKAREMPVNRFQFLALDLPAKETYDVSVSSFHPHNGGPNPTPDKALLEWKQAFGPADGDVVDGLTARLAPEKLQVKAGEDIRVAFELRFVPPATKETRFAPAAENAFVWDGKYSNGYRNHAFLVETPDRKTHYLRPKVIGNWDKNVPHPIEVTAGRPYVLPSWAEGQTLKSLADLGLDTSQLGRYTITGLYEQTAGSPEPFAKGPKMWGGQIATAPVVVEVR